MKGAIIIKLLGYLIIFAWLVFCLFPLFWALLTSIKPAAYVATIPPTWTFRPTVANYVSLFKVYDFQKYFMNSVIVTMAVTCVSILIGALAGYGLARMRSKAMAFLIMFVQMVPPMVIGLPLFIIMRGLGLIDTRVALILANFAFTIPYTTWISRQFISTLPVELEEAGLIDGASKLQCFFKVILPLAVPGIIAAAIIISVQVWNEFMLALILTIDRAETLPIAAANLITVFGTLYGEMSAATVIIIMPVAIFVLVTRRYVIKGLVEGAIK